MNTNKTVLSIIDKLKPAKKAVELSIVNDIDSSFDYLEQSYSEASFAPDLFEEWINRLNAFNNEMSIEVDNFMLNGSARGLEEAVEQMRVWIDELELKADDLGISPDSLVSNYAEIKNILESADSVNESLRSSYQELRREANERFGLADFS